MFNSSLKISAWFPKRHKLFGIQVFVIFVLGFQSVLATNIVNTQSLINQTNDRTLKHGNKALNESPSLVLNKENQSREKKNKIVILINKKIQNRTESSGDEKSITKQEIVEASIAEKSNRNTGKNSSKPGPIYNLDDLFSGDAWETVANELPSFGKSTSSSIAEKQVQKSTNDDEGISLVKRSINIEGNTKDIMPITPVFTNGNKQKFIYPSVNIKSPKINSTEIHVEKQNVQSNKTDNNMTIHEKETVQNNTESDGIQISSATDLAIAPTSFIKEISNYFVYILSRCSSAFSFITRIFPSLKPYKSIFNAIVFVLKSAVLLIFQYKVWFAFFFFLIGMLTSV